MADPVLEFLKERGCPDHVMEGGLAGLVDTWESLVAEVEEGFERSLHDYLSELDVRQLLEEALAVATAEQRDRMYDRLRRADRQMRSLVEPVDACLWGDEVAEMEGWTVEHNWWYFSRPTTAGHDLLAQLDEAGF